MFRTVAFFLALVLATVGLLVSVVLMIIMVDQLVENSLAVLSCVLGLVVVTYGTAYLWWRAVVIDSRKIAEEIFIASTGHRV